MENILEKISLNFEGTKPHSFVVEPMIQDLNDPKFLRKLCKSAYLAYIEDNINFCEDILSLLINIPFNGDYDNWTWIEYSIDLSMYIHIQKNQPLEYNNLKQVIYNQFEYPDKPESTRKINLKAFTRRLSGSSLQIVKDKINKYNNEKNFQLEFMYSVSYYSELIYIYSMNEGDVQENIKNELTTTKDRLLEIIDYYKSNP